LRIEEARGATEAEKGAGKQVTVRNDGGRFTRRTSPPDILRHVG
jgi:hypothetical protein